MKKKIVVLIIALFISSSCVYAKEKVTFSDCVDGDTVKVLIKGKKETVRLLAIDTPEADGKKRKVE